MKRRILLRFGLILPLLALLAACSTASAASTTLSVTMSDFKFTPASWNVPSDTAITVDLTNQGSTAHTWTVMLAPVKGSYTSADSGEIYYTSGLVPAGTTKTVTFISPTNSGSYQVICTVKGHFASGMVGQLIVK